MRINKYTIILLLFFTMQSSSVFIISSVHSAENQEIENLKSSKMLSGPIRIAIYDDANTTVPSYSPFVTLTNNYSNIQTVLLEAGYEVTPLTTNQIYNHELKTARYDVFIMADHMPKTNITNFVKEYWLGGGSLLSMDSALSFICYVGILPPESEGDHGLGIYWDYLVSTVQNITTRHPVSRSYQVDDTFTISNPTNSATPDWVALQGTSIASELVKIATRPGEPDEATVVAFDPQSRGGKVVHIVNHRDLEDDAILIDAIEWLCPKPKGRILYDSSHLPYYGIDSWDDYVTSANYGTWRDTLVSRGYTVDKLYSSTSGNLTSSNLLPYDMLFICMPYHNFTASEVTAVTQWVNLGGGLIAIGENAIFIDENNNINYLYKNYDMQLVSITGSTGATYFVEHPTTEGCIEISASAPSSINYMGDAYPIWGHDSSEIYVAGQEYGNGRVLLMSEVGPFRNGDIVNVNNEQYAINVANWLTASEAEVLLYVDEPDSTNYYRTPVANALNELGIDFYLTSDDDYMNLSLSLYDWELLILDNPWKPFGNSILNATNDYVKGGGRLIMSTFRVDMIPTHALWASLGFEFNQEQPGGSSLYIWSGSHAIFNEPVDYGTYRFDSIRDYGDEGDLLRVLPGAISLGGYTATETENNTNIVLGNGGKTLFNGYLIDQFTGDLDDSTYADNFELWTNEIAFMWAQILATTPSGGIPGYDVLIVFSTISLTVGLIAIITIKKKKLSN